MKSLNSPLFKIKKMSPFALIPKHYTLSVSCILYIFFQLSCQSFHTPLCQLFQEGIKHPRVAFLHTIKHSKHSLWIIMLQEWIHQSQSILIILIRVEGEAIANWLKSDLPVTFDSIIDDNYFITTYLPMNPQTQLYLCSSCDSLSINVAFSVETKVLHKTIYPYLKNNCILSCFSKCIILMFKIFYK